MAERGIHRVTALSLEDLVTAFHLKKLLAPYHVALLLEYQS